MSSHYAVAKGKKVGIFPTWNECQEHTKGFKGAIYKKFSSQTEAEQFITEKTGKPFPGANPGANSFDSNSSCSNEPCGKRPKFEAADATMGNQVPCPSLCMFVKYSKLMRIVFSNRE